jgi:hypothetical protein
MACAEFYREPKAEPLYSMDTPVGYYSAFVRRAAATARLDKFDNTTVAHQDGVDPLTLPLEVMQPEYSPFYRGLSR